MDVGVRDRDRINHRQRLWHSHFFHMTNSPSEKRLEELREQAWKDGVVPAKASTLRRPDSRKPGYYGPARVKPPVWTWQVPLYFFHGRNRRMSAVIALAGVVFHHVDPSLATNVGVRVRPCGSRPSLERFFHRFC